MSIDNSSSADGDQQATGSEYKPSTDPDAKLLSITYGIATFNNDTS